MASRATSAAQEELKVSLSVQGPLCDLGRLRLTSRRDRWPVALHASAAVAFACLMRLQSRKRVATYRRRDLRLAHHAIVVEESTSAFARADGNVFFTKNLRVTCYVSGKMFCHHCIPGDQIQDWRIDGVSASTYKNFVPHHPKFSADFRLPD